MNEEFALKHKHKYSSEILEFKSCLDGFELLESNEFLVRPLKVQAAKSNVLLSKNHSTRSFVPDHS